MIQFLLHNQVVTLTDLSTQTTVLDYLRLHQRHCGTKEGCASGDCGACTVVVASPNADHTTLQYQTLNSCITLMGALHGKQLITVEHLAQGTDLHPVQHAMVECHGSQCGFCTPGFIMSLFALWKQHPNPTHADIEIALGGNLCRCTGYNPIIKAALALKDYPTLDHFKRDEAQTLAALKAFTPSSSVTWQFGNEQYFLPQTRVELAQLLTQYPSARLVAGSTDLALELTQQLKTLPILIGLNEVKELQTLQVTDTHVVLGAARSYSDCYEILEREFPAFAQLLLRLGSQQIRNQGTMGGNIGTASPIGDTLPVLIALNAEVELQKGEGVRKVALDQYFTGYRKTLLHEGEFIASVHIPRLQPHQQLIVDKVAKRWDDDISAVCAAWCVTLEGTKVIAARSGYGGMAAIPARAKHTEQALLGKELNAETVKAAQLALSQDFQPMSDVRASSWYRLTVAQNLLERLRLTLVGA